VESVVDAVSSGGKDKLGSISKQGDRYFRSLFTAGALAVIRYAKIQGTRHGPGSLDYSYGLSRNPRSQNVIFFRPRPGRR
jgi:hypothetical protein